MTLDADQAACAGRTAGAKCAVSATRADEVAEMGDPKLWLNVHDRVVHPDAPRGGGGQGYFGSTTPAGSGGSLVSWHSRPALAGRHENGLDNKQKEQILVAADADAGAIGAPGARHRRHQRLGQPLGRSGPHDGRHRRTNLVRGERCRRRQLAERGREGRRVERRFLPMDRQQGRNQQDHLHRSRRQDLKRNDDDGRAREPQRQQRQRDHVRGRNPRGRHATDGDPLADDGIVPGP